MFGNDFGWDLPPGCTMNDIDEAVHTPGRPFCFDMTCYCHTNQQAIAETAHYVSEGLLSSVEADRFYRGKMV